MRRVLFALLLLLLFAVPGVVSAQNGQDAMTRGILAFREGRYTDAVAAFRQATTDDATKAEAHFLLARIYFETPLKDAKTAGEELDRALAVEPDNIEFLVARMQQLREESWNFFTEKIREQQRVELADRILKLDSTNAFAHEELGSLYIRDFWRYRNAISLPKLSYNPYRNRDPNDIQDPIVARMQAQMLDLSSDPLSVGYDQLTNPSEVMTGSEARFMDPNAVFLSDEFDTDRLRELGIPVQELSGRAQKAYEKAISHLHAALRSDPRHRSVYDFLMEIYSLKGEWTESLKMLQQMYVFFPEEADLWTYLGLAHYRSGNVDASAKAFESSFQYMDDHEKTAFSDLSPILSDEDKKAYADDPAGFTARYWTSKDPRYLTSYNERKLEHYARLTYADLLYAAPDVDLRGWDTQRGQILVRYGVPQADVVIIPRSSTGLSQPTQNPVVIPTAGVAQGVASQSAGNLRAQTSDLFEEANTYNIWDYGDFKFVFEDPFRNGEYRIYSPPASAFSSGSSAWYNDYVIRAAETFREVPDRYDFEVPGRQIDLPYLVAAFRGDGGSTDLLVNYGIPLAEFPAGEDIVNITANAGLFVINSDREVIAERRRTIYGLRTEQVVSFDEANLWVDSEKLTVPSGQVDVSVEFETTSGGTSATQRRSIAVPDFSGADLAVSDVMLAYRVEESEDGRPLTGADVVRHGLSILPSPWSVFAHTRPIYLYFEVYNLTLGQNGAAQYDVEAALVPKDQGGGVSKLVRGIFGSGAKGVSVSLLNSVEATDDGQYLILDASNQETGLYTLRLKVTDRLTGKNAERTLDLFLE